MQVSIDYIMSDCRVILISALALSLVACVSTPALNDDELLSDELIGQFNDAARDAVSKPKPRARSGSRKISDVARSAVIEYDRRHVHIFASKIRKLNVDYYHHYIDGIDWSRRYQQLFVERGVVPNYRYRGKHDDYLLKLKNRYALNEQSVKVLRDLHGPWWSEFDLETPAIRELNDTNPLRGKNYHFHGLTVIDPPAIRYRAARMSLDENEFIEAVALHEAAHAIHAKILGDRRSLVFKGKLDAISEATGHGIRFLHYREVTEFLADAVAVQLGSTAIRVVASRIVRGGKRIGFKRRLPASGKIILRDSHDASAIFLQSLIREEQKRRGDPYWEEAIDRLSDLGNARANRHQALLPGAIWVSKNWVPFIENIMQPAFEQRVREEYAKGLRRIFEIVVSDQTDS